MLDASISPDIAVCSQAFDEPSRCLFDGAAYEELADVGPWLIELRRYGDAFDWFVGDGWGKNWGIVIQTRLPLARLKTHLKKFIKVEDDDDGQTYFFKFYRPEHLKNFLPEFDPDQQQRFMQGIDAVLAEQTRAPQMLERYAMDPRTGIVMATHDLVATRMPLRIQPPDPAEVELLLAALGNAE